MTSNPRIAILPRQLAAEVITAAVARGGWVVAIVILVLDLPVLIEVLVRRGIPAALPLPLVSLLGMLVLLIAIGSSTTRLRRLLYLVGAVAFAGVYTVALLRSDPSILGDATYLVNRPAVALILLGPVVMRPLRGLFWSAIGLVLSLGVLVAGCLIAGVSIVTGFGPYIVWAVYAMAYLVVALITANQASAVPDLARLEQETKRMALESQFEQRAAAVIHDTLLDDLTTVMNTTGGLDERARERFRTDVATLESPRWFGGSTAPTIEVDPRDAELRNGAVALVSEMQWRGLSVDVTGTNDSVVRLSRVATEAVHGAVRACLENVLLHSGQSSAQLVVGGSQSELTYMVIDHGVGFDPDSAPSAGHGLSDRVIGRIEALGGAVRVWSRPGSGTSVLIVMPAGGDDDAD